MKEAPRVILLHEVVVAEILSRLPTKSILRFRGVSKSWMASTNQEEFILLHQQRARNKPKIILLTRRSDCIKAWSYEGEDVADYILFKFVPKTKHPCLSSANCNGLIVFSVEREHIYVLNPCTQELAWLPLGTPSCGTGANLHVVGLGYNPSTKDYKVVRLFHRRRRPQPRNLGNTTVHNKIISMGCEVFTLGGAAGGAWRQLPDPIFSVSIDGGSAFANGSLHWIIDNGIHGSSCSQAILAFDFRYETFRVVPHPPCCSPGHRRDNMYLVASEGLLCLVDDRFQEEDEQQRLADIWLLKDYANGGTWTRKCSIDFNRLNGKHRRFIGMHDGKVLLASDGRRKKLDYYDPRTETYESIIGPSNKFLWRSPDGWNMNYDPHMAARSLSWCEFPRFYTGLYTESLVSFGGSKKARIKEPCL